MRRLRMLSGTLIRIVIFFAIIAALIAVPLITVYKSRCRENRKDRTRYSFVLPWDDPPKECRRHQSGLEIVRDYVGLD